jgi:hypothetical protein
MGWTGHNGVLDVQHWLGRAVVLAEHYIACASGGDVCEAWTRYGSRPLDESDAWDYFTTILNHGLGAFQVRLELYTLDDEGEEMPQHVPWPDLYEALCLQLHQLIVSGLPVRACANETCQRAFTRQRGTAEYGQYHTTGVAYCSRACAKAQIQREYRRRKRKETF